MLGMLGLVEERYVVHVVERVLLVVQGVVVRLDEEYGAVHVVCHFGVLE